MKLNFWGIALVFLLPIQTKAMGYSSDYLSCVNSGQSSYTDCAKAEFKRQDDRMEKLFKLSLNLYSEKDKKVQKKYQKQWVKQRDLRCDEANKSLSDVYKSKYYTCALKDTLNRANYLDRQTYRLR